MMDRVEFKKRKKEICQKAEEVKKRLGITVKVYITDYNELLKGNNVVYPIEDAAEKELKERIFNIQTMAMRDYAAGKGAELEIKTYDD